MATEQQLKDAGATVKFGLGQIANPTPKAAKWANRIITGIIGVYGIIIANTGANVIPEVTQELINPYIIMIPAVTLYVSKLFGWNLSTTPDTDNPQYERISLYP